MEQRATYNEVELSHLLTWCDLSTPYNAFITLLKCDTLSTRHHVTDFKVLINHNMGENRLTSLCVRQTMKQSERPSDRRGCWFPVSSNQWLRCTSTSLSLSLSLLHPSTVLQWPRAEEGPVYVPSFMLFSSVWPCFSIVCEPAEGWARAKQNQPPPPRMEKLKCQSCFGAVLLLPPSLVLSRSVVSCEILSYTLLIYCHVSVCWETVKSVGFRVGKLQLCQPLATGAGAFKNTTSNQWLRFCQSG